LHINIIKVSVYDNQNHCAFLLTRSFAAFSLVVAYWIALFPLVSRLGSSDNLLLTIQEKIKWADSMSEQDRRHKKEVEDKAEEIRKAIKVCYSIKGFLSN
jgi:hypothetical protein